MLEFLPTSENEGGAPAHEHARKAAAFEQSDEEGTVFSADIMLAATVYVTAESAEEAERKFATWQEKEGAVHWSEDTELELSDEPGEIMLSPAMTSHGFWPEDDEPGVRRLRFTAEEIKALIEAADMAKESFNDAALDSAAVKLAAAAA